MRDPFRHPLEPMTSQHTQAKQRESKERQRRSLPARILSRIVIAILVTLGFSYWMAWDSKEPLVEEPGSIQDGVYYLYKGSPLSKSYKGSFLSKPSGLYTYTPGQKSEALVTNKEYHLAPTVPFWGVNAHGLFFIDESSDSLYCMDLDTRAVTQLYTRAAEAYQTDLSLTALYLYENHIVLQRRMSQTDDYLILDCETGRVLGQSTEPPPELSEPQPGTAAYEVQRLGLPATKEDIFYTYLDVADQWLFYIASVPKYVEGQNRSVTELWAMDIETQKRYLIQDEIILHQVVTDGTWLYDCDRNTNCYQLEYNDQGIPCGLTLIEEDI